MGGRDGNKLRPFESRHNFSGLSAQFAYKWGGGKLVLTAFEWLSGKKEKNGEQSRRPITIASFFFIYLFFIIYFWPHRAVAELFIYPLDYVMYSFHSRPRFGTLFDPLRV